MMRTIRRLTVVGFFVACAAIVVMAIVAVATVVLNPFSDFAGRREFTDLTGAAAKRQFGEAWPSSVDPDAVETVTWKTEWSRDSYSSWYRVVLDREAALRWMDQVHERSAEHDLDFIEGVHRTVAGPPPLHRQTGDTPAWWSPPAIDFRATEIMRWYTDGPSSVGGATYSAFDASTNTLSVYEYSCQHDRLWPRGQPPAGTPIHVPCKTYR